MAHVVREKIVPPRITVQLQRSFQLFSKLDFLKGNKKDKKRQKEYGVGLSRRKTLWADDSDDDTIPFLPMAEKIVPGAQQALSQDFDVTLCDRNKMMSHILDCVAALHEIQEELRYLENQEDQEEDCGLQNREKERAKKNATGYALNKTFQFALSRLAGRLNCGAPIDEKKELSTTVTDASYLYPAFPDDAKQEDNRGWLPLHWAVASGRTNKVHVSYPHFYLDTFLLIYIITSILHLPTGSEELSEEEVKRIYVSDPMALLRYHQEGSGPSCKAADLGFTPVHLLCMLQTPSVKRNMQLLRYFSQYEGLFYVVY